MTTPPERLDAPPRTISEGEAGESRLVWLLPVLGAPLGMGAAILASFAIAGWHMTHAAVVQVETA